MRFSFAIIYLSAVAYAQNPGPTITSLQPSTVNAAGGAFTLTVNGSGIFPNAIIKWSGTALDTTVVGDTQATAIVPAGLTAICGRSPVTLTNFGGAVSNGNLTVLVNPVLSALSPTTLPAGSGSFTISAFGAGFSSNVKLRLNASGGQATLDTNYALTTLLTAVVPASALTGVYPISLQVTDPSTGGISQPIPVTLTFAQVTQISPEKVNAGDDDFQLNVAGSSFAPGAQVLWNGTPLVTKFVNSGFLIAIVPAAIYADPAGAQVGVAVKNPGTAPTNAVLMIVNPNQHGTTLTSLDPPAAITSGPAFTLTATGSRFTPQSKIVWVTTPLPTTFVDSTKLTATVPANLFTFDGSAPITIATPGLTDSKSITLPIVSSQPAITSLSPASVRAGSPAFTLTVNGAGFVPASSVEGLVGATAAYVSSTQLMVSVPASAIAIVASYNIRVINPGGNVSQVTVFTTKPATTPVLSRLTPSSTVVGGRDFTLTVTGSVFSANAIVFFNDTALATTPVSATQLTSVVPSALIGAQGTAKVAVANEGPVFSNSLSFTITGPAGSIVSLTPSSAITGGTAFTLTINGAGFTANSQVQWNGAPLSATFVSDTQLTAAVPATLIATTGTASVTVTGSGLTSNALVFTIGNGPPSTSASAIVNAASSAPAIAPGTLISIYGSNLSGANAQATGIPLATSLGGTTVSINGTAAPLLFVSPGQINAQVPYEIAIGTAKLTVQSGDLKSPPVNFDVAATGPGVFTLPQTNHVVAQNLPDYTLNGIKAPALPGQYCTLYVTGQGLVAPPVSSGSGAPDSPLSFPQAVVQVQIGGQPAEIQFAGLAPSFVGLLQINVRIPDLAAGEQPVDVTIGVVKASQTVITVGAK